MFCGPKSQPLVPYTEQSDRDIYEREHQEIDRHAGSAPSRPTDGELATQVLTQMVQRPLPAGPDAVHIGFGTVEDDSGGRLRDEGVFELEHGGTVRGGGQAQLDLASRSVLIDPRDREQAGRCAAQDLATRVAREAERAADTENARYITSYVVPA
jgi:hypothetical protein